MRHGRSEEHRHAHPHGHGEHGHTHGAVDPTIATSERGIWAIKWSFVGLMVTALLQLIVVLLSGSVALLSDTIHNFGDAATAIPLGVAFALSRLGASRRFTFGYGRVEDLAGVLIVLIILFSAVVAGYQAVERIINPQPVELDKSRRPARCHRGVAGLPTRRPHRGTAHSGGHPGYRLAVG
jgi:Co/Zn/Cd efflux system component